MVEAGGGTSVRVGVRTRVARSDVPTTLGTLAALEERCEGPAVGGSGVHTCECARGAVQCTWQNVGQRGGRGGGEHVRSALCGTESGARGVVELGWYSGRVMGVRRGVDRGGRYDGRVAVPMGAPLASAADMAAISAGWTVSATSPAPALAPVGVSASVSPAIIYSCRRARARYPSGKTPTRERVCAQGRLIPPR